MQKSLRNVQQMPYLFMLDIDDFKMINDTQGHAVGDMVLSQTGSILSESDPVTGELSAGLGEMNSRCLLPAFRILLKWKNFVSPCVKI